MRETTRKREETLRKAALKVFCRKGYHYASIRDIAKEAGIRTGSVYYYVNSKEDLLEDALTSDLEEMTGPIERIANSDLPPDERLRQAIEAHLSFVTENMDGLGVFMQDWHSLSPERESKVIAKRDHYEGLFRKIVQDGIKSGHFNDVDVSLVIYALFGMCNYLFVWYSPKGKYSAKEIAAAFAELLLNGLLASAGRDKARRQHHSILAIAEKVESLRRVQQAFSETQAQALAEIERQLHILKENSR